MTYTAGAAVGNDELERAVGLLRQSGRFQILREIPPLRLHEPGSPGVADAPTHGEIALKRKDFCAAIIDSEATSADAASAIPIEIGIIKLCASVLVDAAGNAQRLLAVGATAKLVQLNDPGVPIPPESIAVHGISDDEVRGKALDLLAIDAFMADVDFAIAHNASYDRPVLARHIPSLGAKPWTCSLRDVDWHCRGCTSRTLDYLLYKAGLFHNAHRALADCHALSTVIEHEYAGWPAALLELYEASRRTDWFIHAVGADFDAKDKLKARGYRWSPGDDPQRFPAKTWSSEPIQGRQATLEELIWLRDNAYGPMRAKTGDFKIVMSPMSAAIAHSADQNARSWDQRREYRMADIIAKLSAGASA